MMNPAESHVLHRDFKRRLPVAMRGEGAYVIDSEGRRYLDASGGPAVSCLGHSHPRVIEAIRRQAGEIAYAYTLFFTAPAVERLADRLVEQAPEGLARAFFVAGGAEAVESAIKLARQYHLETGQPGRRLFIARRRSYHGNTLATLALGEDVNRRAPYEAMLSPVEHIAPCYEYRDRRAGETAEQYGIRIADELDAAILKLGAENVAGFICEPVTGASLGAAPPVPGYLKRLREICDRHGVLLIFDEVMCGMGRTGHMYACAEDGVTPDLLTMAKGLGGGYAPIGGVLAHRRIVDAIAAGSGVLKHGTTYSGHTLSCAAALAVQEAIAEEGLLENVRTMGGLLRDRLHDAFGQHPHVGDIRGRGMFLGLEIVADRETKAPFDPGRRTWLRLREAAMERGLICYPSGGCIDGASGDHVILAPPYNLTEAQTGEIVDKLAAALGAAIA
ncbi:MAG TPA: aspartate aminotransferase family protein [Dongiaceae bacterium]|nr:aspartate aminotransferase family protein [Dongiaceae bacterium]